MAVKSSSSQNQEYRNRGTTEPKKKLKKLKSIKLSKVPSLKPSTRRAKPRFDWASVVLSSDDSSLQELSATELSDTSPNHMKASNFFDVKKDARVKGHTELKKTLRKARSKKRANAGALKPSRRLAESRFHRQSIVSPDVAATLQQPSPIKVSNSSPNYLKTTGSSGERKMQLQESPGDSKCSSDSRSSHYSVSNSAYSSRRTSGLSKEVYKDASAFKSKRRSVKKHPVFSQDPSIEKATCSSTLKGLKFPEHVELHPGETETGRVSVMEVCPYHHCSLNGHCHAPAPPTKNFLSKRRQSLKTQKSMKVKCPSTSRRKHSGEKTNEFQTSESVPNVEAEVQKEVIPNRAIPPDEEQNNFTLTSQNAKIFDYCLSAAPLKPDDQGSTCSEEAPNLNSQIHKDELSTPTKESIQDELEEAMENTGNSQIDMEASTPDEDFEPQGYTPADQFKIKDSAHDVYKLRFKKNEHISMWHLIHQHMLSGLAEEAGIKPLQIAAEGKQVDDARTSLATGSLSPDLSDSDMGLENHDAKNQDIELRKVFAIKLVREAIEKILLPEVPDHCSDNQSVTSDIVLEQELSRNNHDERGELSKTTSTDLAKDNFRGNDQSKVVETISKHPKEEIPAADYNSVPQEEKTAAEVRSKTDKQAPKRWSNLKKLILLNRFIKELEKVREFNLKKPHSLPLEQDRKAEKVCLRRQMTNERKNTEEWMLDYALRRVVSQLAPSQKRKVALLVKAFETVAPAQEDEHVQVTSPKKKDKCQGRGCTKDESEESVSESTVADQKAEETVPLNLANLDNNHKIIDQQRDGFDCTIHPRNDSCLKSDHSEGYSHENVLLDGKAAQEDLKDTTSNLNFERVRSDGTAVCSQENMPGNGKDLQEFQEDTISRSNAELEDESASRTAKFNVLKSMTSAASSIAKVSIGDGESRAIDNVGSSASDFDPEKQLTAAREEKNGKCKPEHVEKDLQEAQKDAISFLNTKLFNDDPESTGKNVNLDVLSKLTAYASPEAKALIPDGDGKSTTDVNSSTLDIDPEKQLTAAREERREPKSAQGDLRGSPLLQWSESDCRNDRASKTQLEKQNNIRMWHMIYQHVASDIAAKVGRQLLDEVDEVDEVGNANTTLEREISNSSIEDSKTKHDPSKDSQDASHQKTEFSKSDAVKLVQEAIDEILLPDIQDDLSDAQSTTSDIITDQELFETKPADGGDQNILTSSNSGKGRCREFDESEMGRDHSLKQEERESAANNVTTHKEERTESVVQDRPEKQRSKNWSKLKKLILLKRSIKALEKARQLNRQTLQHLPLMPEPGAEKIDLRHQMTDERKKAEQWMLDYAVQHIVTKLTPARKKRVAMLVEAFEAVVPLPEF